jgi:hypothetical protein
MKYSSSIYRTDGKFADRNLVKEGFIISASVACACEPKNSGGMKSKPAGGNHLE